MKQGSIKYPVGISNFKRLVSDGYLYVDKTDLVYNLVSDYTFAFLSRPRRFGKSLLSSTLESYFRGEKDLFAGLKINEYEKEWKKYPVFRFDLSGESFDHPSKLITHISNYLKIWEGEYGLSSQDSISQRFAMLIRQASKVSGTGVVVLIDEYDKPLLDSIGTQELQNDLREQLRGFYSVIKACEQNIRFAFLTGVTKFSKVSVFSGLNNLSDISLTPSYNAMCGISETEIHKYFQDSVRYFAEENAVAEADVWRELKDSYDGYHFARSGEDIYNPISVINTFKEGEFRDYWYDSGKPDFLFQLIKEYDYEVGRFDNTRRRAEQLGDMSNISTDIVPLLFQSGYLTIKGYDPASRLYTLGFPNREVSVNFWDSLAKQIFPHNVSDGVFSINRFVRDVENGNPESFMTSLKSLMADTPSSAETKKEVHFQNMLAIVAKMLSFEVQVESHSAQGRCDMVLKTQRFIYIFEFKVDSTAQKAVDQIIDKGYATPYLNDRRKKYLIGANFSSQERTLTDWTITAIE